MSNKETKEEVNGTLAALTLLFIPLSVLIRALVLVKFWNWFIVPLGVVSIGHAHSLALSSFASYVVGYKYSEDNRSINDKMMYALSSGIVVPFMLLGWGWLLHLIAF